MISIEDLSDLSFEALSAQIKKAGGQRAFSKLSGIPRTTLQGLVSRAYRESFKHRPAPDAAQERVESGVRRFILTSAQDATKVHEGFLRNLEAYRDWFSEDAPCDIMIAGFTYNKSLFEDHGKQEAPRFHDRVQPYLRHERVRLGDVVDWCAEMNTSPTAVTPLQGFETYTRHRWGIFPHAKVQLRSVPTMKHEPAKVIMTTGAVTLPNYVLKRAGLKASFHHVVGAVLVEIDADGTFFCRHLIAEDDGTFRDLDRLIHEGEVTTGERVEAINWGDLHVAQIDKEICSASFGVKPHTLQGKRTWLSTSGVSMLDVLKPKYQFYHDVSDFQARNHHNIKDAHKMFALFQKGRDSVENELREVGMFIDCTKRDWCQTVIVDSNHDQALTTWLRTADHKVDPLNARFWLECSVEIYRAMEAGKDDFSIFQSVLQQLAPNQCKGVRFLAPDESFKVLDIEKGLHGHHGANGARGSVNAFARMGSKSTTGHGHAAEITDGAFRSGTKSKLDMGYNVGLSSWSHSDVVTLPNGKRQIVTWSNGKFRL